MKNLGLSIHSFLHLGQRDGVLNRLRSLNTNPQSRQRAGSTCTCWDRRTCSR